MFFKKIDKLIEQNSSFVVETTLAGKYQSRLIKKYKSNNYKTILIYIFVENDNEAIHRIDIRYRKGGHTVPVSDVQRRFKRSRLFFI